MFWQPPWQEWDKGGRSQGRDVQKEGPAVSGSWRGLCLPEGARPMPGLPLGTCWGSTVGAGERTRALSLKSQHLPRALRSQAPFPSRLSCIPQPGPGPSSPHTGWRQQQDQLPGEGPEVTALGGCRRGRKQPLPLGRAAGCLGRCSPHTGEPCLPEQRELPARRPPLGSWARHGEACDGNPENKQIPLLESKSSARAKREPCDLGRECRGDRTAWAKPCQGGPGAGLGGRLPPGAV